MRPSGICPSAARRLGDGQVRLVSDDCTGEACGCANKITKTADFIAKSKFRKPEDQRIREPESQEGGRHGFESADGVVSKADY